MVGWTELVIGILEGWVCEDYGRAPKWMVVWYSVRLLMVMCLDPFYVNGKGESVYLQWLD